ncbi:MAG: NAD-dependent epimerase/dehydratase family protein [Chlorobi bacterium]|nr:NAD-dependent epimerase/dehydratase family protein [Chlorobiota bacterium]
MKVVITGGAGFIGSNLAEFFTERGVETHVIDNLRSGFEKNLDGLKNVVFHKGSITDFELVERVVEGSDYAFNLAALISVPESLEKPEECVDINVKGLLNVLKAAEKHGVKKVVHASSAAVYGDDPALPKIPEMTPQPKTPYAITKLDGEYYLKMYYEEFGLNTASLRFFNVYGPKQDPKSQYAAAIPIFIFKALKNEDITIYGDGEQTRDFVFVKDVAKALFLAVETEKANSVYNVANGSSTTIKKLAENIIELTNSKSKIKFAPERSGDIKHSLASIEKTEKELGFSPSISLEEGLLKTIEYFKKRMDV